MPEQKKDECNPMWRWDFTFYSKNKGNVDDYDDQEKYQIDCLNAIAEELHFWEE